LWVPPDADRLRGVLFGGHTLMEPEFAQDPLKDDFRMRPDAPLLARIGFRPIPVDEIGLYPDPYRAAWPVKLHKNGVRGP
jgi:hypothetical protein